MIRDEFFNLVSEFGASPFLEEMKPIMAEYDRLTAIEEATKKFMDRFELWIGSESEASFSAAMTFGAEYQALQVAIYAEKESKDA